MSSQKDIYTSLICDEIMAELFVEYLSSLEQYWGLISQAVHLMQTHPEYRPIVEELLQENCHDWLQTTRYIKEHVQVRIQK